MYGMAKLVKKEGAIEICPSCNQQMVCNQKTAPDGNVKLQWQNDKGESHYLPPTTGQDGKTVFACRPYTTEGVNNTFVSKEPDLSKFKAELVSKEDETVWYEIVAKTAEYTLLAQKKLGEYPEITNGATKGLITKIAFEIFTEFKKSQRLGKELGDEFATEA